MDRSLPGKSKYLSLQASLGEMASADESVETDSPASQGNCCRGSVVTVTSSEFSLTLSTKEGQTLQLKVGYRVDFIANASLLTSVCASSR